jgi:hypothetical protein
MFIGFGILLEFGLTNFGLRGICSIVYLTISCIKVGFNIFERGK